jgi:hypothetical protein
MISFPVYFAIIAVYYTGLSLAVVIPMAPWLGLCEGINPIAKAIWMILGIIMVFPSIIAYNHYVGGCLSTML